MSKSQLILQKEAERQLSQLTESQKQNLAKKHKKYTLCVDSIFGSLLTLFNIATIIIIPILVRLEEKEEEPTPVFAWIFLFFMLSISIGVTVWLFWDLKRTLGQTTKELAIRATVFEFKKNGAASKILQQSKITDPNFKVSKEVPILASGWLSAKLLIDYDSKKFIYRKGNNFSQAHKFSDIINYEIYENGKSKVQGRAGSALIGGAFLGLGGLIVGSSMGRSVDSKCNQLELIIRVNNSIMPQIKITFINNLDLDKSSDTYKKTRDNLHLICSELEYMINAKKLEEPTKQTPPPTMVNASKKEQLQELKEMLDDGLITQEDYEQKKKQILGL